MSDRMDALVIFGATGDLAKLETFPALVGLVDRGVLAVPVIGVAKSGWNLDQFRAYAAASLKSAGMDPRAPAAVRRCSGCCATSTATSTTTRRTRRCHGQMGDGQSGPVLPGGTAGAVRPHRPGHRDGGPGRGCPGDGGEAVRQRSAGAQELNATMHQYFPEDAVYRVDHWLGLDAVNNVLFARFANSVFEPLLNRTYVESIQITMAEAFDVVRPRAVLRPDRRHPGRGAEPHAAGAGHRHGRPAGRARVWPLAGRQGPAW